MSEAVAAKNRCRHFNGIQNEFCAAGIRYHDLAEGSGCALRYPCLPHPTADRIKFPLVQCAQISDMSDAEIADETREMDSAFERFLKVRRAAEEDAKVKGIGKPTRRNPQLRGGISEMACPACKGGILRYSIAEVNGHMHGKCSTEGCVSWME